MLMDVRSQDFARCYIWPNMSMPSATILINSMMAGSQGRFTLEGVENHAARKSRIILLGCHLTVLEFRLSTDAP